MPPDKSNYNVSQYKIIEKLIEYINYKQSLVPLQDKKQKFALPFQTEKGFCSGLAAYWLYCNKIGDLQEFRREVEHVLQWQPENMFAYDQDADGLATDPVIEHFMHNVEFLQYDQLIRTADVRQSRIDLSINYLLPEGSIYYKQVEQPEFKVIGVFSRSTLADMIRSYIYPGKMVHISNRFHTIAIMLDDQPQSKFHLYDPDSTDGEHVYATRSALSKAIFAALDKRSVYADSIEIYLYVFDLVGNTPGIYPAKTIYIDQDKILGDGGTLLSTLILDKDPEALYELLVAGADPNIEPRHSVSLWELAYYTKNDAALVLLLAFGLEVSEDMKNIFSSVWRKNQVFEQAIVLNKTILEVPDPLQLDCSSGNQVISFLRHAKLRLQLGCELNAISLSFNGKLLNGVVALKEITNYYMRSGSKDIFECAEKMEIYTLLKYFKQQHFSFRGSRELVKLLAMVTKQIVAMDMQKIPQAQLPIILDDIAATIVQLNEIVATKDYSTPAKIFLTRQAIASKRAIEKYMKKNGIQSIVDFADQLHRNASHCRNYLFFTEHKKNISYAENILPVLRLAN